MVGLSVVLLPRRRRRLAGAEGGLRFLRGKIDPCGGRVRAAEDLPRNPFRLLERCHGLSEIAERSAVILVECPCVIPPHPERGFMTLAVNAARNGHHPAQQ